MKAAGKQETSLADLALTYTIDPALRVVRILPGNEPPTLTKFERMLDRLERDPRFDPGFGVLVDRRQLAEEPTHEFVLAAIETIAQRRELFVGIRWASVASELSAFETERRRQAFAERGITYAAFTDETEAVAWLRAG